jgi:hypothetical protein
MKAVKGIVISWAVLLAFLVLLMGALDIQPFPVRGWAWLYLGGFVLSGAILGRRGLRSALALVPALPTAALWAVLDYAIEPGQPDVPTLIFIGLAAWSSVWAAKRFRRRSG